MSGPIADKRHEAYGARVVSEYRGCGRVEYIRVGRGCICKDEVLFRKALSDTVRACNLI
jgi:hypothetical protein